ncbi:MAG: HAMP domain-containing sensor histidine kinase [Clostridium sp.]|nr:HAMP domain-containing sensor histidine kinase [Clostridium sp.]
MMIKKKLTISNILMLVIPVILIYSIAIVIRAPIMKMFENNMNNIEEFQNGAYFVQDVIKIDKKKLDESNLDDLIQNWNSKLKDKGYNILVTLNDETLLSTLDDNDKQAIEKIGEDTLTKANSLVLEINGASIVKNGIIYKKKHLNVLAINSAFKPPRFNVKVQMTKIVVTYVTIVVIISIVIITITNWILSSKIYKSFIKPLELLSYGADQIKKGNLDFDMKYEEEDEFRQVCNDFDEMRMRLQDSVQSKLKYEENRKELVAGISHDLRTPLTVIKGYVEGLIDGVANTEEKQKKYLNTIFHKACEMNNLVDSLFLFSKLDTGKFPFKFDIIDIGDYISGFYNLAKDEFIKKNLKLEYKNLTADDIKVKIDCREIDRVITNILENSVKYNINENKKSKILLYEENDNAVLEISDNGQGVNEEMLDKLFDSFYRGDPSRTRSGEGSGLGLSISKYIVEAHEGKIEAFNREGLTIKITLPIASGEEK